MDYVVKKGDTLSGIAKKHGLKDWRTIYNHPNNAEFKKKRPDPNKIYPGDKLFIPVAGGAGPAVPVAKGPASVNTLVTESVFRIHPAIGVARVGEHPTKFFIGPEVPLCPALDDAGNPVTVFKDGGKIIRQGARFRIYQYTWLKLVKAVALGGETLKDVCARYGVAEADVLKHEKNVALKGAAITPGTEVFIPLPGKGMLTPFKEITTAHPNVDDIEWKVHLVNNKAAFFKFDGQTGAPDHAGSAESTRRNSDPAMKKYQKALDPGEQQIMGKAGTGAKVDLPVGGANIPANITTLGELHVDDKGRLIVLGGKGEAGGEAGSTIGEYANNDSWFDDVSDGPVKARIKVKDPQPGQPEWIDVEGAWCCVGPPDYSPAIGHVTTLWDTVCDLHIREVGFASTTNGLFGPYEFEDADGTKQKSDGLARLIALQTEFKKHAAGDKEPWTKWQYKPSFMADIWPTLLRTHLVEWTHDASPTTTEPRNPYSANYHPSFRPDKWSDLADPAKFSAKPAANVRRLRDPGFLVTTPASTTPNPWRMPKLFGDFYDHGTHWFRYHAFPKVLFAVLRRWRTGNFIGDWDAAKAVYKPATPVVTPDGLDRAALEHCVGGAFYPGIEVSWLVRLAELWKPDPKIEAASPFRVQVGAKKGKIEAKPGLFSQQMAQPWQADFHACAVERDSAPPDPMAGDPDNEYNPADPAHGPPSINVVAWWPGIRPDNSYKTEADAAARTNHIDWDRGVAGMQGMATGGWKDRGFIVRKGAGNALAAADTYIEVDGPP